MNVCGVTWGDQVWTVQAHVILQVLRNLEVCRACTVSLGHLTAVLSIPNHNLLRLVSFCMLYLLLLYTALIIPLVPAGCVCCTALLAFVGTLPTEWLLASQAWLVASCLAVYLSC